MTSNHRPQHADDPLFRATGLCLQGREGAVFGPLDWQLDADAAGVVMGRQGSGRSALLLALAGRLTGTTGALQVGDVDAAHHPRALRRQVSVARISGLAELEPWLTVAESRDERAIADGAGTRRGRDRFRQLEQQLDHRFDAEAVVDRLPAVERTLLTLVLGCLAPARYVVLDDLDAQLTEAQQRWVLDAMAVLEQEGNRFVVSVLEDAPLPRNAQVLHLAPPLAAAAAPAVPGHPASTSHPVSTSEPAPTSQLVTTSKDA